MTTYRVRFWLEPCDVIVDADHEDDAADVAIDALTVARLLDGGDWEVAEVVDHERA